MRGTISRITIQSTTSVVHHFALAAQVQNASLHGGDVCPKRYFHAYDLALPHDGNSNSYPITIATRFFSNESFIHLNKIEKAAGFPLIIISSNGIRTILKVISDTTGLNHRRWTASGSYYNNKEQLEQDCKSPKNDLPLMPANRDDSLQTQSELAFSKWFQYKIVPQEGLRTSVADKIYTVACADHHRNGFALMIYRLSKQAHLRTAPSTLQFSSFLI